MMYKYDRDDESSYYDINNNPKDTNEVNILLLLDKYDYNIMDNDISSEDQRELKRIISRLYEDTIKLCKRDLNDYIMALITIKYSKDHKIYYVSHAERLRSKFIEKLKYIKDVSIAKEFMYTNVLSKENIENAYRKLQGNNYTFGTEDDIAHDIDNFTSNNIFDEDWLYDYVMTNTLGCDERTITEIKDLLVGGYYHEYDV